MGLRNLLFKISSTCLEIVKHEIMQGQCCTHMWALSHQHQEGPGSMAYKENIRVECIKHCCFASNVQETSLDEI